MTLLTESANGWPTAAVCIAGMALLGFIAWLALR